VGGVGQQVRPKIEQIMSMLQFEIVFKKLSRPLMARTIELSRP
jgi:hypothetical protein